MGAGAGPKPFCTFGACPDNDGTCGVCVKGFGTFGDGIDDIWFEFEPCIRRIADGAGAAIVGAGAGMDEIGLVPGAVPAGAIIEGAGAPRGLCIVPVWAIAGEAERAGVRLAGATPIDGI